MKDITIPDGFSFDDINHVLCILEPIRIYPAWEKFVCGKEINQINFWDLSLINKILMLKPQVQMYSANPRSVSYLLTMMYDLCTQNIPDAKVDLLINHDLEPEIPDSLKPWFHQIIIGDYQYISKQSNIQIKPYDVIILIYQDAIGLGWGSSEKILLKMNTIPIMAINGRRRLFCLDNEILSAMRKRRFLEKTCLMEIFLICAIFPVAIVMAGYDLGKRLLERFRIHK